MRNNYLNKELNAVIHAISSLPGIGYKSAMRIAFFLLKKKPNEFDLWNKSISNFYNSMGYCPTCNALISKKDHCLFCNNPKRDKSIICVVEQPSDIYCIENTGDYFGMYHVLMGVLDPMEGVSPEDIKIKELQNRIENPLDKPVQEIIIATNPSIEGDATANYIARIFAKNIQLKITRISSGMAMGSQLDFTDSYVIAHSLKSRQQISI